MPTIAGYSHLSLTVSDLRRSTDWYRDLLGFSLDSEVEGDGFRRNRLRHPDAGITLTLTAHQGGSGDRFDERRTGMDHVSFAVPTMEDLLEFKERFAERGVDHSDIKPTVSGAGGIVTFRDPDNIQLEVFAAG
ncbi:MAG: VOC family protein [Actinomycetota bacterium]|nr:VOC family protein [Actinomycetota bacterium]